MRVYVVAHTHILFARASMSGLCCFVSLNVWCATTWRVSVQDAVKRVAREVAEAERKRRREVNSLSVSM